MAAIQTVGLVKKFGWFFSSRKVHALNNLTLTVPENCIFGFLGPNGAGKTTTIKIILGLILPNSGKSQVFGASSTDKDVRDRIGFLPDDPQFYPHLTAEEFLLFVGKLIHLEPMERARRAHSLLERVGMQKAAGQKMEGFSRGQQQRLGIAQCLMSDPDLIVLDEPITGLDPMGRRDVKQIMADLRDAGKTVFFSSHVLSDVEQMCDRVAIVNHGRVIEEGTVDTLCKETGTEIWIEKMELAKLSPFEPFCESIVIKDDRIGLLLADVEKKEQLLRKIGSAGGKVREVIAKREELETYFLNRVQADDEAWAKQEEGAA